MKNTLIALSLCILLVFWSCRAPVSAPERLRLRTTEAMKAGGILTYTETVTDSTVLPTIFADSSSAYQESFTNPQTTVYSVAVSIPDTTKPWFKTITTITSPSVRDTSLPASNQIWQTIAYGTNVSQYNQTGGLVNSFTVPSDTEDLNDLPMMAEDTFTATDSMTTVFTSGLTGAGLSVSYSGSEIVASGAIPDTTSFTSYSYYNPVHLTMDSSKMFYTGSPYSTNHFSYSTIGAYRVATTITNFRYLTLPITQQDSIASWTPEFNFSALYTSTHVTITSISSVSIP
jgi:hypothetical protein